MFGIDVIDITSIVLRKLLMKSCNFNATKSLHITNRFYHRGHTRTILKTYNRGLFRTLLSIYDGVFL